MVGNIRNTLQKETSRIVGNMEERDQKSELWDDVGNIFQGITINL